MFKLNDPSRRSICKLGFLLGCIAPTLVTSYCLFHQTSVLDWQRMIQAETGLVIKCDRAETPTPSQVIFRNVSFGNPELSSVAGIDRVIVDIGQTTKIRINETLHLQTNNLKDFLQLLRLQVLPNPSVCRAIEICIERVELQSRLDPATYMFVGPVLIGIGPGENSTTHAKLQVTFDKLESPFEATLVRETPMAFGATHATESVFFSTGNSAMPMWAVEEIFPTRDSLGGASRVTGTGNLRFDVNGPTGCFKGFIGEIDLQKLIAHVDMVASGRAGMDLSVLEIIDGKVVLAEGEFRTGYASISSKLLQIFDSFSGQKNLASPSVDEMIDLAETRSQFSLQDGRLLMETTCSLPDRSSVATWKFNESVQNAICFLTSPNAMGDALAGREGQIPNLVEPTDKAIGILRRLQLQQTDRTAEQPFNTYR